MKLPISLYWLLFFLLGTSQLAWSNSLPLIELWQAQGFCLENPEYEQDYIQFKGKNVYGAYWQCRGTQKPIPLKNFKDILVQKGFKIVTLSQEVIEAQKNITQGKLYIQYHQNSDYSLNILKQTILKPGENIELSIPENSDNVYFYLDYPPDSYLSMKAELPKGVSVDLKAYTEFKKGKLKKKINYNKSLQSSEGQVHILYDLPLVAGLQRWSVENSYGSKKVNIKLSIQKEGKLLSIPPGDKIGGILLKNVPYGKAKVKPEKGVEYFHPALTEDAYQGDLTPQGDVVFWLTPGYWQLEVTPFQSKELALTSLKAHLLPVFPGHLTEVNWPASINQIFQNNEDIKLEIIGLGKEKEKGFVDFSLLNTGQKDISPQKEELSVQEAGIQTPVLSVERLNTPPRLVVLLDSSGSMKGSMQKALKATTHFLKGLPANSIVTLIDFDTKPKELGTGNPQKIIPLLSKVRANGATALYDSIIKGLNILTKANRPTLIVFTDGKDANFNDSGPGSKATQQEVFTAVKNTKVPIFSIGFGKNPDVNTLSRLAALSGGNYYPAQNLQALNQVFQRIQENLGHQWRAYFKRPQQAAIGNKPVLSLVIDNSGSMEGKIEKVRQILHDFVSQLPQDFLIQLLTFSDDVQIKQVLTTNKLAVFRGIAEMKPLSGTEILDSLRAAYKLLHSVPSSQRYLIYLTDEALEVGEEEQNNLDLVLEKLKDDGVKTLFIGMLQEDKKGVFTRAAQLARGEAVINPRVEQLALTLKKLLQKINKPTQDNTHLVRLIFKHTDKYGRTNLYSAARVSSLPLPKDNSQVKNPETLTWKIGEELKPYDGELRKFITGDDAIGRQVRVTKRLPLNVSASNKAVRITLKEIVFLSKLRGIKPSRGRFMALTLSFENVLKPQKVIVYPNGSTHPAAWVGGGNEKNARIEEKIPDYLIPDARLHLFLSWNNQTSFPVSEASYLAETPLILPNANEIYIRPGKPITGTLIFLVPNEFMEQSALHLYDTAYGHIDLPISGVLKVKKEKLTTLPTKVEGKLSDTFKLEVNGFQDLKKIFETEVENGNIFRLLDLNLISKVQAHLSINPKKRFFLAIDTSKGSFIFPLHPITQRIPLGFYKPRLVTPGSYNKLRLAFEIPQKLASKPCRLLVDLKGGGVELPLTSKPKIDLKNSLATGKAKGLTAYINGVYQSEDKQELIVDLTLVDSKDDFATSLSDFLVLMLKEQAKKRLKNLNKNLESTEQGFADFADKSKGLGSFADNRIRAVPGDVLPDYKEYLTAFPWKTMVLNGQNKRGFLFFKLPEGTKPADFIITSEIFKDLHFDLSQVPEFPFPDLLTQATTYEEEDQFTQDLSQAVARLMQIRKAKNFTKPRSMKTAVVGLESGELKGLPVETPSFLSSGGQTWKNIKNLPELKKYLQKVRLKASNWRAWNTVYSPEAIFTQGWMTENELAYMAEKVLNRRGLETKRLNIRLTEKGKKALHKYMQSKEITISEVPGISYEDEEGRKHTLVFPFFQEASEIPSFIQTIEEGSNNTENSITLEVEVRVKPIASGRMEVSKEISDALAGGGENTLETITLLSAKLPLPVAGLNSWELGFTEIMDRQKGRIIRAILDTPLGRKVGDEALQLTKYEPVQVRLRFYTPSKSYETVRDLKEKEWPTELFFVLGINVSDLPLSQLKPVNSAWHKAYKEAPNPDVISSLKWLGRGIIARFVGAQTEYEQKLAEQLGLELVRLKQPRILVVGFRTSPKNKHPLISLDLVQPYPELRGKESLQKRFNLLAGFYYSALEAKAVPDGLNAFKLLSLLPKEDKLLLFTPEDMSEFQEILAQAGYPLLVREHFKDGRNFVLFPEKPLLIKDNNFRVAWLEFDPETNKVWSFLDTGERGVVDTQIGEGLALSLDYMLGFWVGIQTSVWSTADFSLILDNWAEIKNCAHGFARSLASYLEAATQPVETLKPTAEKVQAGLSGDIAGMVGLSGFNYGCMGAKELQKQLEEDAKAKAWSTDDVKKIFEGSEHLKDLAQKSWNTGKEKYLGFSNGFKDGVEWYFQ